MAQQQQIKVWLNGRLYVGNPVTGRYKEVKP